MLVIFFITRNSTLGAGVRIPFCVINGQDSTEIQDLLCQQGSVGFASNHHHVRFFHYRKLFWLGYLRSGL